jgi:hypothetical protein
MKMTQHMMTKQVMIQRLARLWIWAGILQSDDQAYLRKEESKKTISEDDFPFLK